MTKLQIGLFSSSGDYIIKAGMVRKLLNTRIKQKFQDFQLKSGHI